MLRRSTTEPDTRGKLTVPSELFGIGRFGKETSASLTTSPVSGGMSSSSYSSAWRRSLSGDGSLSESGPEAAGDSAVLLRYSEVRLKR